MNDAAPYRRALRLPLAAGLILAGCSREGGPPVYSTSGKVLVDGKPAGRAEVSFFFQGQAPAGMVPPVAVTEADGTFRPSTRASHDGAPAGEYALTVVWKKYRTVQGEDVAGDDQLGGRYADPARSGLKATIHEGDNALPPLELKSRP